jgi:transketolase
MQELLTLSVITVRVEVGNGTNYCYIDRELLVRVAEKTGKVVTAEEHTIIGGLGSAVSEVLSYEKPVPIRYVGIQDCFGCSGSPDELLKHYKLTPEDIVAAAKSF